MIRFEFYYNLCHHLVVTHTAIGHGSSRREWLMPLMPQTGSLSEGHNEGS